MATAPKQEQATYFAGFAEYWHFAKTLTESQRHAILRCLSSKERKDIERSYDDEGWEDVFMRDTVNQVLDDIKASTGYDVLDLRVRVFQGRSVFVPTTLWPSVMERLSKISQKHHQFATSGVKAIPCKVNPAVSLLLPVDARDES